MRGMLPHLPDETMDPERMRIRTRGRDEMARHSYTRDHTAWDFKNGLPIGNGDIGCMICGAPSAMRFIIGKNDLWWDDYESPVPCTLPGGIKEVRERAAAGDASLRMDLMKAHNNRTNLPLQTTAAELTLHLTEGGVCTAADPFGGECVVRCLEDGKEILCEKDADGNLSVETAPMCEYALERRGRPLESFPVRE